LIIYFSNLSKGCILWKYCSFYGKFAKNDTKLIKSANNSLSPKIFKSAKVKETDIKNQKKILESKIIAAKANNEAKKQREKMAREMF
jgi:hypothetical protein